MSAGSRGVPEAEIRTPTCRCASGPSRRRSSVWGKPGGGQPVDGVVSEEGHDLIGTSADAEPGGRGVHVVELLAVDG